HLADGRRGERVGIEFEEQSLDRLLEVLADDALDVRVRERPHIVLEATQLGDDVRRNDVRPRGEQLAELDERRPELVEHLTQAAPARRRPAVLLRRAAPPLEEVAEPVLHGHLGDLAQAPDLELLLGSRGHGRSVARPAAPTPRRYGSGWTCEVSSPSRSACTAKPGASRLRSSVVAANRSLAWT